MTRAYETSGGVARGRGPQSKRKASVLEYRHADEPDGPWHHTSQVMAKRRAPEATVAAMAKGDMGEHPSRDGLLVFRRRREV